MSTNRSAADDEPVPGSRVTGVAGRTASWRVLALSVALGLVSSGCGGDDSVGETASTGSVASTGVTSVEPDETVNGDAPVTTVGPTTGPSATEGPISTDGTPTATATIGEDVHLFSGGHCQISEGYLGGSVMLSLDADDLTEPVASRLTLDWVRNPPTGTAPPRSPGSVRVTMADGFRLEAAAIFGAEFEVSISGSSAMISTTLVDDDGGQVPVTIEAVC